MFILPPDGLNEILRCPFCKSNLIYTNDTCVCPNCAMTFKDTAINTGSHNEHTHDFTIQKKPYTYTESEKVWREEQDNYEERVRTYHNLHSVAVYLNEIDGLKEIYTDVFHLQGKILDVGGNHGRLRQYLDDKTGLYVSIDPYKQAFTNIEAQTNLLEAYPVLKQPCYFLVGVAERLPFANETFDWVHVRSALDHFEDPYLALKEAYRVLKPGGRILVGLAIMEKLQAREQKITPFERLKAKIQKDGLGGLVKKVIQKVKGRFVHDHSQHTHVFRFTLDQFREMLADAGFTINHEHWQKPPADFCLYLDAVKKG